MTHQEQFEEVVTARRRPARARSSVPMRPATLASAAFPAEKSPNGSQDACRGAGELPPRRADRNVDPPTRTSCPWARMDHHGPPALERGNPDKPNAVARALQATGWRGGRVDGGFPTGRWAGGTHYSGFIAPGPCLGDEVCRHTPAPRLISGCICKAHASSARPPVEPNASYAPGGAA
jgi:hypothetical protein